MPAEMVRAACDGQCDERQETGIEPGQIGHAVYERGLLCLAHRRAR
jgi:hypothetical protein